MEAANQISERRTGTQRLINDMLTERQRMWVLYCKVSGLEPFKDEAPVREVLEEFLQVLMDYIASSHFGLYERIAAGKERRRAVRDAAVELYPRIAQSTDVAVQFHDDFEAVHTFEIDERFSSALSELGEALATRIELEDEIIERMVA